MLSHPPWVVVVFYPVLFIIWIGIRIGPVRIKVIGRCVSPERVRSHRHGLIIWGMIIGGWIVSPIIGT